MYNLNINKSSVVPTNLIVGRVLDKPFDTFQFKIFDGLDPLDLTGATLDFRGVTPDNKKVISTNVKITDARSGEIEFQLPTNFYSAQGQFRNAYFRINKSGLTESTNDLLINVLNAVDLNLDDSQIIIDQLDKIIEDAISKLDKELANIKSLLQKEKENIEQLKRDVASYKQTFDKQMADMQKQIDDLRGVINSTDVQRPQITLPNGGQRFVINDASKTLHEYVISNFDTVHMYCKVLILNVKDMPHQGCQGTLYRDGNQVYFIGITPPGVTMAYNYNTGWSRLDGQVPKITQDDGNQFTTLDDKNKSSLELLLSLPNGVQSVYLRTATDLPDGQRLIGINQKINTRIDGQFTGVAIGGGNTYSITYSSGTIRDGWKRLDGQVQKITLDNGGQKQIDDNDTLTTLEALKKFGIGVHFVYIRRLKDTPESYIKGLLMYQGGNELLFYGQGMVYTKGTYSFNGMNNEWKRLDNVTPPNVTTTQNGLMSPESFERLNSLWSNRGGIYNLLNQEAYFGVDGFLLDKLTNYEFVDVTAILYGNSVTTRYKVSSEVEFNIPLTNVYNDTSSTGFELWEINGTINDTRVTVSRSKGVKVVNTTTTSNNTSDIKIVGVYGVNKIK